MPSTRPRERSRALSIAACLVLGAHAGAAEDLRSDGAFGFPQGSAKVLCDTPDLRLSIACDATHWFVQAVMWNDADATPGLTDDGRKIGDGSSLVLDADADGTPTREVDRTYHLDPWPSLPGLRYSVSMGGGSSTGLQGDSNGRGSVQYVEDGGRKVRVDTYLIPLDEVGRTFGDEVRFAYWGHSTTPELTVNSVAFTPKDPARRYYSHSIPRESFHAWTIETTQHVAFDAERVPEGRGTIAIEPSKDPPAIGTRVGEAGGPPEISAKAWKNWKGEQPPTLAGLKGRVVVVEFWATWCSPCVAGIPHLSALHEGHHKDGLVILSLTDQDPSAVAAWVDSRADMTYAVGMGSDAVDDYGVNGIPHAFLIGRDGVLAWAGHPADKAFDDALKNALRSR